MTDKDKDSHYV